MSFGGGGMYIKWKRERGEVRKKKKLYRKIKKCSIYCENEQINSKMGANGVK
jgi:hypothetical protein